MKKQSLNFLLLVIFCSYLTFSNCNNLKSESTNLAKNNAVPDYSPIPRTNYLETFAHEDISFSDKMFYAKFNIKDKLQTRTTLTSIINGRLIETQVYVPINLAKLDVELYIQNVVTYRHAIDMSMPWEFTFELYFSDILIGENTMNYNTVIAISSLYLQGTIFHIPAGTYQAYVRVKVVSKNNNAIGLTDWHVVGELTNPEWNQYLIHEYGFIEFAGIGGN